MLLTAFEQNGHASPDAAPASLWGTDDVLTDARLACVIHRHDGGSEAVIVNGRRLQSPNGQSVELPAVNRLIRTAMAHPVHQRERPEHHVRNRRVR